MLASAEFLWRLNQDYVNRLSRARTYLDLLEELVRERGVPHMRLLTALEFTRAELDGLSAEHRVWCYGYFYESPQSKRVVQTASAIDDALDSFGSLRERQRDDLLALAERLRSVPRPDARVTRVPNGDLWEMMQDALSDLLDFSTSVST